MSNKRNSDSQSIGKAIRDLLNSYRIDSKFDEMNIVSSWERLVGKPIARRTRKVFIKNRILYAEFDSPSMKQDFAFHKGEILTVFQKEFGADVVSDIVVI